jgi:hypothetical protein
MENLEGQVSPDQSPQPLLTSENIVEERGKLGDRTEVRVQPCPPNPSDYGPHPLPVGEGGKNPNFFRRGVLYTGA